MPATLVELAANIVSSHASVNEMSTEELLQEIQKVYAALQQLETSSTTAESAAEAEKKTPPMSLKKAFQADQVYCMICGRGGMKTLARHLAQAHGVKPGEYRKMFNIPSSQPLTARNFSESRKKMAQERGLAENLAKARAVRAAKLKAEKAAPKKTTRPPRKKA
ncbi:MAG TPA: MucR family transcriptional regulator [Geobacteraceae bacterium]|nr:MucR family transcriptional regulator [Geobacteraceae bacterium]